MVSSTGIGEVPRSSRGQKGGAPHFDESLQAWILSRYADVRAAFQCSGLWPGPANRDAHSLPDKSRHQAMRAETRAALSPAQLAVWRRHLSQAAAERTRSLRADQPIDLASCYARPLCLRLASLVTQVDESDAKRLGKIAAPVSAAAAEPYDATLKAPAHAATAELRTWFNSGPELLRDSGFVALAHTLPSLLLNAWLELILHPHQWGMLHREPELVERSAEELLRCAGLPEILFRSAVEEVEVNGVRIRRGQQVVLRVGDANRDPARFRLPNFIDLRRRRARHLALGAGAHACVGAGLIRMALVITTRSLVERFAAATLQKQVRWRGGSAFRSPRSLWVTLQETSGRPS
jgi:cytochrome P450